MNLTSEHQLYVGMVLPGETAPVAAALMKFARVNANEEGVFAYGKQYQKNPNAVALHPDIFPLNDAVVSLPSNPIRDSGALPIVIQDALPDAWGRMVLASHNKNQGLTDIELLLQSNDDRVGAMVFSGTPQMPPNNLPQSHDIKTLSEAIEKLQYGIELTDELRRLLLLGGSLGGARPKASFVHDHALWLAKFPMRGDIADMQIMECATLALAKECGIRVPQTLLVPAGGSGYAMLTKRFDRHGPLTALSRIHYLSLSGFANVAYRSNNCSYVQFAILLNRLGSNAVADMKELFIRMVFNMVIDNSDDHIKNHGVLYSGNGRYHLSPAFDMVPQLQNLGYTSLSIDGITQNAHLDYARACAPKFGVTHDEANRLIHHILDTVHRHWYAFFKACHADKLLLEQVRDCFQRQMRNIGAPKEFY